MKDNYTETVQTAAQTTETAAKRIGKQLSNQLSRINQNFLAVVFFKGCPRTDACMCTQCLQCSKSSHKHLDASIAKEQNMVEKENSIYFF